VSQRWWPGLERQLNENAHAEQDREDRLHVEGGRRLPRWLVARTATPYWIGLTAGIVGALVAATVGEVAGWWDPLAGFVVGLVGTQFATDAWYCLGARRLRRAKASPTPD